MSLPDDQQANVDLTAEELKAAADADMTPQRYEEMKGVQSIADWNALEEQRRAAEGAA